MEEKKTPFINWHDIVQLIHNIHIIIDRNLYNCRLLLSNDNSLRSAAIRNHQPQEMYIESVLPTLL